MLTIEDAIFIPLTETEIKMVMEKALDQLSISKRDNLRQRHANIQFDCILRGYIGEYAITKWLAQHAVYFETTNYMHDDEQIDIDFLYKGKNIELKTSLIPDSDATLKTAIENRDIKLIKRENNIEDLKGDIHLQLFFDQRRKAKDVFLTSVSVDIENEPIQSLYNKLKAHCYLNTTYFVGWIDKLSLISQINVLPKKLQTWSFSNSQRNFWLCKLATSKIPASLPAYLKRL